MSNPFDIVKDKIDDIKRDVTRAVQVWVLREDAKVALSRLMTIDPGKAERYQNALDSLGDD